MVEVWNFIDSSPLIGFVILGLMIIIWVLLHFFEKHCKMNEKGSAAEYAIIAALIAVTIVIAVAGFGSQIKAIFDSIVNVGALPK